MNFLGVGPFELLLILVIATIVLGPERMAQAGRTAGRLYAQYRLRWQKDVDEMTRELRRELAMLQQEVEESRQTAESEIKSAQTVLENVADAVDGEIKDTQTALKGVVELDDDAAAPAAAPADVAAATSAEGELTVAAEDGGLAQPSIEASPNEGDAVEAAARNEGSTPAEVESDEVAS
jgi:sec-independent protein translocase protein TatB